MAMLRADGFGHFTSAADWALKGHNSTGDVTFDPTDGRGGRGRMRVGVSGNAWALEVLPTAIITAFHHFAFKTDSRQANVKIASFRNATVDHVVISGQQDSSIRVLRSDSLFSTIPFALTNATVLGTTNPNVYLAGTYHQVQIKIIISSTVGEVTLFIDGAQVLSLTGINTYGGGTATITQVGFGNNGSDNTRYSDVVVCDDSTALYNTYLGDVAVYESVQPVDGDELQWTRSTGAGTWSSHVDSNPQTGDAEYLRSTVNGDRNCFSFPTVTSVIGTPLAIKSTVCHRKEDAAYGALKVYSRSTDAIDHDQETVTSTQTYHFSEHIFPQDLKDTSAWSIAKVNATQLGFVNVS